MQRNQHDSNNAEERTLEKMDSSNITKEREDLQRLMEVAHKGFQGLLVSAEALLEIQDRKLYRCIKDAEGGQRYKTFEEFLKSEFNYTRSYFCQLKNAYSTHCFLVNKYGQTAKEVMKALPQNISTFYEISKFPEEQQNELIETLKEDVSQGIPITKARIIQLRKPPSAQDVITATCETAEATGTSAPAGPPPAKNALSGKWYCQGVGVTRCRDKGKTTGETHIVNDNEDMPEPSDTDVENVDDVTINDDDDKTDEEESPQAKGKRMYDTIYRLLDCDELYMYLAADDSAISSLEDRFQDAMKRTSEYVTDTDD